MTRSFFTWVRRFQDLSGLRGERPARRKKLETIKKSKRFLDFEILEGRNPAADAIGPFLATSALSISGQVVAAFAPPPVVSPSPKGEVHTQPVQGPTQPAASPPLTLSEGPVGPKNVSSQPTPVSQAIPPPAANAASGGIAEGKPLFTSLG